MNKPLKFGFIHYRKAWYGKDDAPVPGASDQISIGFVEVGQLTGEICINWYGLGNRSVPRLECFNDSWEALTTLPGLLPLLANLNGIDFAPEHLRQMLLARGYVDLTPRTNPHLVRFRLTETMPGEGGEIKDMSEIETLPDFLMPLRSVLYAPDFLTLTISRDDSRTRIERIRE